jgi:hypothetical protein
MSEEIKVGDLLRGTGTHRVRVEVKEVNDGSALCRLWSGGVKQIALATLRTRYERVTREEWETYQRRN